MRHLNGLGLVLLAAACATARPNSATVRPGADLESAEARELARLEDARLLGEGRIEALTRAVAPGIRIRALLALARLQAPETAGAIGAALDDPHPEVRSTAAFALGQLGLSWTPAPEEVRVLAERRLLERLGLEADVDARDAILEALGKVGGAASLGPLAKAAGAKGGARAAIALGVLAKGSKGKLKEPTATPALSALLESKDDADRFAGAYALMQIADGGGRAALAKCLADPAIAVRAACVRGLASLGEPDDVAQVAPLLDDPDERVAAEAARGLARLVVACQDPKDCPAARALGVSKAPWRPAVAAAVAAEPITAPERAEAFVSQRAATTGRAQCAVALAHDRAVGRLEWLPGCGGAAVSEAVRAVDSARALAEARGDARAAGLLSLAKSPVAGARAAAVSGLAGLGTAEAHAAVVAALADNDWTVAAEAAGAVEAQKIASAEPALLALLGRAKGEAASDAAQAALSAAGALKLGSALPLATALAESGVPHVRLAAGRAIESLTGKAPAVTPPPWPPSPYAEEPLPERPVVRLETDRGVVRLRLFARDAPATVRNFVGLSRKGFYDGLAFHRVVPDFVAQGGDPRGDGSGGPGYTIRCEANRRRYGVGTLGMALSGKDTGGSQFFVTLSPQPHLDGRYTVFGEVASGLEVVRALEQGDRIRKAVVEAE